MTKLVGVAAVVLCAGVVYAKVHHGSAPAACDRLESLCGDLADKDAPFSKQECTADLDKAKNLVGADTMNSAEECVSSANSCVEAVGCFAGATRHAADDFQRGFDRGAN